MPKSGFKGSQNCHTIESTYLVSPTSGEPILCPMPWFYITLIESPRATTSTTATLKGTMSVTVLEEWLRFDKRQIHTGFDI